MTPQGAQHRIRFVIFSLWSELTLLKKWVLSFFEIEWIYNQKFLMMYMGYSHRYIFQIIIFLISIYLHLKTLDSIESTILESALDKVI